MTDELYRETRALINSSNLYHVIRDEPREDGFTVGAICNDHFRAYALQVSKHSPLRILVYGRNRMCLEEGHKKIFEKDYDDEREYRRDLATLVLGYIPGDVLKPLIQE